VVRIDAQERILEANAVFCAFAECDEPEGRPLSDFLTPTSDFLDAGGEPGMMARPDRPDRAAFVLRGSHGVVTVIDASERYAAGRALRDAHALADRTRTRLELIIESSIALAEASTEDRLADILAVTTARAYRAEESVVYLDDGDRRLQRIAGSNPFEELIDLGAASVSALGMRQVLKVSGIDEARAVSPVLADAMSAVGVQSIIAAPLRWDATVGGLFACFFHHPRSFDEEAAPLADALAGQAARALATLRLQRRLEHAAQHDDTTGLHNRRRLEDDVAAFGDARRLAVMFIDLDGFKAVNDRLGHPKGDEILREVARRLQSHVREGDIVARYGGDEFVVVCEVGEEAAVAELAERLRDALRAPYLTLPPDMSLGASIGVAISPVHAGPRSIDRLIRSADQAMYAAKLGGGNRVARA